MNKINFSSCALVLAGLATVGSAQNLMIPDSTADRVMLFSAADGSLVDADFIDLTIATPPPSTPIEAISVGDEIWISDQVADTVFRFSSDGTTFLGTTTAGRDNMRGIGLANGSLYATNAGTGGGGFGDACKEYLLDGTLNNVFTVGDPFDVMDFGGSLLIANIADDNIDEYGYDGTFIGTFHDSDGVSGIDFPEQLSLRANGNVLAGGFSSPSGIYEYDSAGNELNFFDTTPQLGVRGVAELGNGLLLFTNGGGVHTYDPGSGMVTTILGGASARFIAPEGGSTVTSYCTAKTGLVCGIPAMSSSGVPAAGASSGFTVSASPARGNRSGLVLYSCTGRAAIPFQGGLLCVNPGPLRRSNPVNSGGTNGQCDGVFSLDWNEFASGNGSGNPDACVQTPGQQVNTQYWGRDSVATGSFLSDALEFDM